MKKFLLIILSLIPFVSIANCTSAASTCENTTLGILELNSLENSGDDYSHLILNGNEIYKAKTSYMVMVEYDIVQIGKKYFVNKGVISYTSDDPCYPDKPGLHCGMNVILDLTSGKPVISNGFFSEFGDSKITWVSWGKANSIIVIDDELRFKYSNGHVERVTQDKDSSNLNTVAVK